MFLHLINTGKPSSKHHTICKERQTFFLCLRSRNNLHVLRPLKKNWLSCWNTLFTLYVVWMTTLVLIRGRQHPKTTTLLKPSQSQRTKLLAKDVRGLQALFFFCAPKHLCWVTGYHIRFFCFHSIHSLLYLHDYNILLHPLTYVGRFLSKKPLTAWESCLVLLFYEKLSQHRKLWSELLSKWKRLKIMVVLPPTCKFLFPHPSGEI